MRAVVPDGLGVFAAILRGLWLVKDDLVAIIGIGLYFVLYGLPAGTMIFIAATINLLLGAVVAVTLKTLLDTFQSATFTLAYPRLDGHRSAAAGRGGAPRTRLTRSSGRQSAWRPALFLTPPLIKHILSQFKRYPLPLRRSQNYPVSSCT